MRRDFDLLRRILFAIEAAPEAELEGRLLLPELSDRASIAEHVRLLRDGGLLEAEIRSKPGLTYVGGCRLTWAGHEFIDASRDESRWNTAKERGRTLGFAAVQTVLATLVKVGTEAAVRGLNA